MCRLNSLLMTCLLRVLLRIFKKQYLIKDRPLIFLKTFVEHAEQYGRIQKAKTRFSWKQEKLIQHIRMLDWVLSNEHEEIMVDYCDDQTKEP